MPDTPLFVKTHDFLLWLIRHTQRFPKNLRHSYAGIPAGLRAVVRVSSGRRPRTPCET